MQVKTSLSGLERVQNNKQSENGFRRAKTRQNEENVTKLQYLVKWIVVSRGNDTPIVVLLQPPPDLDKAMSSWY